MADVAAVTNRLLTKIAANQVAVVRTAYACIMSSIATPCKGNEVRIMSSRNILAQRATILRKQSIKRRKCRGGGRSRNGPHNPAIFRVRNS